jgi:glycerol-3-phosphate dehydrogenase
MGKGILLSPTVDGNLLAGPTSENKEDKTDKDTTQAGLAKVMKEAQENVDNLFFGKAITSFSGLRAVGSTGDFIITSPKAGFVNAAGIESPGLSAAPAIALYITNMLKELGLVLEAKENYNPYRKSPHFFRNASLEEKNEIIKKDSRFGHIICRCETITEGEIVYALHQNPKPSDLDGVKRRTRAQMGRCQGGFCSPLIVELISQELGIPYEKVTKTGGNSLINIGKTKGEGSNV